MINLDNIYENIIAEIVVLGISFLISKFAPNLIHKEKVIKNESKFDIFNIIIFFTSVSIFNLILNLSFWNKSQLTVFLTLLSVALFYLSIYIYNNQCPSCKKFIRAKKRVNNIIIKEFTRPYKYQPIKIWLYSNGEIWKKKSVGEEKTRIENWVTKQEFYECNYCKYKWDSGHFDINLDKKTRPKPEVIHTDKNPPNDFSIS